MYEDFVERLYDIEVFFNPSFYRVMNSKWFLKYNHFKKERQIVLESSKTQLQKPPDYRVQLKFTRVL
jgi:hypothetical protein